MSVQYTTFALLPLLSAAILAALAAFSWRRRGTPAAGSFAALMLAACGCKLAYAFGMLSGPLGAKLFWTKAEYLGSATVPLAWAAFALAYAGLARGERLRRVLVPLAVVPLCTVALVWSNGLHGLLWTSVAVDRSGPFAALEMTRGSWFWVHAAYSYALVGLGTALLVFKIASTSRFHHPQGVALLGGAFVSWGANALHLLGVAPVPHLNPGVLALPVTGVLFALALFRFRFLEIHPVARATAFDGVRDGLIVTDTRDRIVDLNQAAARILGHLPAQALGREASGLLHTEALATGASFRDEISLSDAPGASARRYDLALVPLEEGGCSSGRLLSLKDVTETRGNEEALAESEKRFRGAFEGAAIGMALADADGTLLRVNSFLARTLGYEQDELRGKPFSRFTHPEDRATEAMLYRELMDGRRDHYRMEQRLLRKDGSAMWARLSASAITDEEGNARLAVGTVEDVTERRALEKDLAHRAFHDPLTDLPNRSLFMDRLGHALERATRSSGGVAVLFLDLDGFKWVNDSFGHAAGDRVLVETATRLRAAVRPGDTVARLGGDEFAVLLEDAGPAETGEAVSRIEEGVRAPFSVGESGPEISVTASVGVAAGSDEATPEALVRAADQAMYGSKHGGKGGTRPIL